MERVRRRFWTFAVSGIAVLVITGAIISGLFQLAVLALPSYRDDLSGWVTEVAGRPVQIGGVSLVWRGFSPHLDLSAITLFNPEGDRALAAERLSLGFSLLRLLTGEVFPNHIELSGLSLAVEVDAEGRVRVAGFDKLSEAAPHRTGDAWLDELARFKGLTLQDCEVLLSYPAFGHQPLPLMLVRADFEKTQAGFEADGELRLPRAYGRSASFSAVIRGELARLAGWQGEFTVDAGGLQPQAWLDPWLAAGSRIEADDLELRLRGALDAGRLADLRLSLEAGALGVVQGGRSSAVETAALALTLTPAEEGWQLDVQDLRLGQEQQLRGQLRYRAGVDQAYALDVDADLVRLTALAPWLGLWRNPSPALQLAARSRGELQALVLRLRQPPQAAQAAQYSLRAGLHDVGLRADRRLGFAGLTGELSASESGGSLQLGGNAVSLQLPASFREPVPFEALTGTAEWRRTAAGWEVAMPAFGWRLATTQGSGDFKLLLPDEAGRSPELNLQASFSAEDVTAAKRFIPLWWGPGLQNWLERAIDRGRVPQARLAIRGPLADFPFDQRRSGEWKLDIDATQVRLDYAQGWPAIDELAAHLSFRGNGLKIESEAAEIGGIRAGKVLARFDDFRQALLQIDASTAGEMARFYQFLRSSPLRRTLAGLVDNTSAAGPAQLQLHLDIPLREVEHTQARGTVAVDGVEMFFQGLDQPISAISGDVHFDNDGVTADELQARFAELALAARIEPRPGTRGVIVGDFAYAPDARIVGGAGAYIPGFILERLSGESRWQAELALGVERPTLVLTSELVGTSVDFPQPLGKVASEPAPLRIFIGSDAEAPLRVGLAYQERLGADIALRRIDDGPMKPRAIHLRLGTDRIPKAEGEGLFVDGEVAELDLAAWGVTTQRASLEGIGLRGAEITAGRLLFGRQAIGPTHLQYAPTAQGWQLLLKGAGAEGEVDFEAADGGRVRARLAHLVLDIEANADKPPVEPAAQAQVTDPTSWPALDIQCNNIVIGGTELGQLQLKALRTGDGLQIEGARISGGKLDATASGQWRRAEGQSSAELKFDLNSGDVAAVLRAFKYAPNVSARATRFTGEVLWPPAAKGIEWEQAQGRIELRIENGALKAVEPGAGRVLGLINFYALPRRLTLDFRDVVNEGLAFDTITGSFQLAQGVALTDDVRIEAPSLRMEMRGRVGLVARDYDQRVTVYPDVSAGVTLGAALLGGPALAALVLLAQEVLDKPLDQATQLSYRLTGTWDNPKVERIGAEARNAPRS